MLVARKNQPQPGLMRADVRATERAQWDEQAALLWIQLRMKQLNFAKVRTTRGADPLLKAIGSRAKNVLDATAGWGTDAVHLARAGYHVLALEKNRKVAAILLQAQADCTAQEWSARLEIVHGDSVVYLREFQPQPDVVYLDPMYPLKKNSAAAKKSLVLLRRLVGPAADSWPLFEQAMNCARQRVVIKRPRRAPPLHSGTVGEAHGKLVRFDIYHPYAK